MQQFEQQLFIEKLELELEAQLQEALKVFQNLPEDTLIKSAANGGWSIAECFEHLNTYAEFYQPRIRKALAGNKPINFQVSFNHSWIGQYFITMMDASKSKKKYKAIKKHRPMAIKNPHEVLAKFIQHLEDLVELLKAAHSKELQKIKISTSLSSFIKMNAGDTLQFLLTHNRRHINQAKGSFELSCPTP
jgi:uncharacterized damage-inducible protein DinB